jgi:hypothetical protein
MTRHHFADYYQRDPQGYVQSSNDMWNTFVSITHKVGLKHFFSFTPDFSGAIKAQPGAGSGKFKEEELQSLDNNNL